MRVIRCSLSVQEAKSLALHYSSSSEKVPVLVVVFSLLVGAVLK